MATWRPCRTYGARAIGTYVVLFLQPRLHLVAIRPFFPLLTWRPASGILSSSPSLSLHADETLFKLQCSGSGFFAIGLGRVLRTYMHSLASYRSDCLFLPHGHESRLLIFFVSPVDGTCSFQCVGRILERVPETHLIYNPPSPCRPFWQRETVAVVFLLELFLLFQALVCSIDRLSRCSLVSPTLSR